MPINPSSLAAADGAGVQNTQFTPAANDIPRNIVIVGTFNPALAAGITAEIAYGPYSSVTPIGATFGNGYMIHRLALALFSGLGSGGPAVWVIPQAEVAGAAATSNGFVVTGTASAAGTLALYVNNTRYAISVNSGDTPTVIGGNIVAAFVADPSCPLAGVNTAGSIATTSLSKGPWGNSIALAVNILPGDALPGNVTCAVTAMSGGTGVPVMANALNNGLGTLNGSNANTLPSGNWMTDLVHGYLATTTTMTTTLNDQTTVTAISAYNGLANASPPIGCYDHLVGKPFRCIMGDNTNSATLPAALTSFATTNNQDRTDAILSVPGSRSHPCEIAAVATGVINVRAGATSHRPYVGMILPGVEPGPSAMWAAQYSNRDLAVKGGISPVIVQGGYVTLQNIVTFYACNSGVPVTSNGYREWANLCKLQNIIASMLTNFRSPKWQGFTIVADSTRVTDPNAKQWVRSISDVVDELVALAKLWETKAWIYNSATTINGLKSTTSPAVVLRPAGDGFTAALPGILSGVGNIVDSTFNFDISLAAVTT